MRIFICFILCFLCGCAPTPHKYWTIEAPNPHKHMEALTDIVIETAQGKKFTLEELAEEFAEYGVIIDIQYEKLKEE